MASSSPKPNVDEKGQAESIRLRQLSHGSSEDTLLAPEGELKRAAPDDDAVAKTQASNFAVAVQGYKKLQDGQSLLAETQAVGLKRRKTSKDGSSYPKLPSEHSRQQHEREAWRAGGIRFAPIKMPLKRRLQTAAVFLHCMSIGMLVSLFWFTCANPLTWPILLVYLLHLSMSTAATDGKLRYRSEWLRSLPLWRLFAGYYPMRLHKTHELPPNRRYILGYHPHGIISHGAWCAFATNALGFGQKFPGITNSLLTLDSNFRLPFYRDWILAMGIRSVSKESIRNILSHGGPGNDGLGRAVTIVIGGARESLEAQPGSLRLILRGRKGFIKMALRTGADLVPVIGFGENDLYDQLGPGSHPVVRKVQMFVLKAFKFTIPALHGRGLLNYDVGLMPYRRQVNIVVGKPIRVEGSLGPQPSQEEIDRYHDLYIEEVERLYEAYSCQFSNGKVPELQIIA
ncbi:hypothetical protein CDD81_5564 [Ophiocordyceps australis]|uniref:Diacylglycerol O-acyltransferase n=1 Tax=Ophiocordyceps australis TaxID=1399860 RepID=A0A2C5Y8W5_9HYPO|nr:hypothetical protein CDD81_5564 [Ophiocordyceps australis]